jgi:DNA-binding NarL/FixJ family response regulator
VRNYPTLGTGTGVSLAAATTHSLSAHESEVLSLMAEGRSNGGIGRQLWVTEGTVEGSSGTFSPN